MSWNTMRTMSPTIPAPTVMKRIDSSIGFRIGVLREEEDGYLLYYTILIMLLIHTYLSVL